MAMPKKLKNFNTYSDGESFRGLTKSITLPPLTRKMEEWRGGGTSGPVKVDFGQEALEVKCTYGGVMQQVLKQYGLTTHDGLGLRFAGAYQREDTGAVEAHEVIVRGRLQRNRTWRCRSWRGYRVRRAIACELFQVRDQRRNDH